MLNNQTENELKYFQRTVVQDLYITSLRKDLHELGLHAKELTKLLKSSQDRGRSYQDTITKERNECAVNTEILNQTINCLKEEIIEMKKIIHLQRDSKDELETKPHSRITK